MTYDEFRGLFNQTTGQGNEAYCYALYCQAKLETGNFTSNIYNTCKNLFGMRPSSVRTKYWDDKYTTAGNGEFASYASRLHSVIDRVDLDTFNNVHIPSEMEQVQTYYQAIKAKGYTHETNYVPSLMQIFNTAYKESEADQFGDTDGDLMDDENNSPFWKKLIIPVLVIVGLFVGYKILAKKFIK